MYRRKIKNRKEKAAAESNLINQETWLHDRIKAPNDANLALNLIKYNYLQMLEIRPTKNYENYKNFFSKKIKANEVSKRNTIKVLFCTCS